jgi:DNA-binding MarR family transcriptional regulator
MKSAYELAMERLGESSPTVSLTTEQKAELASINANFTAKIAEKELFLDGLITKAKETGNYGELAQLEEQKVRELSRLREKLEEEKDKVRNAG